MPPSVILCHPRDPGTFCGTDDLDVEDWLSLYERVSCHNRWDPTVMLANLYYYLKGSALQWYETNEEKLTSWETFKEGLKGFFGKSVGRQLAAKQDLSTRVQTSTEPYLSYIQDVLSLCNKVDREMSESDKIGHIMKGIADDAFNLLVIKNCTTVEAVIAECRRFEEAKSRRIVKNFTRLPNTAATSSCEDYPAHPADSTSPDSVTRIVRRELEAISPAAFERPPTDTTIATVALVQSVVRQELDKRGVGSLFSVTRPDNYDAPRGTPFRDYYGPPRSRNPAEWRTPDDRPICFTCCRIGHVARYCPIRWPFRSRAGASYYQRQANSRPFPPRTPPQTTDSYRPSAGPTDRPSRSPSPRRRQSPSPQTRRFSSPPYPGRSAQEN